MSKSLNLKYAFSQIFYYSALSSMLGFAAVLLLSRGFSNSHIGIILAVSNVIAAVLQPSIAVEFDKSSNDKIRKALNLMIVVSIVLSLIIYFINFSKLILGILFTAILCLIITLMPFMNSMAFMYEEYGYKVNFGLARGLGSVGYAITSMVLGFVLNVANPSILLLVNVLFSVLLYWVIKVYTVNEDSKVISVKKEEIKQLTMIEFVRKYKLFVIFLVGATGAFFAHTFINNFFIQVVNNVNGTSSDMGNAIFIAAMIELPVMMLFEKINKKFSCTFLMKVSMFFFFIKHFLTYLATNVMMIYIAQVIQMFAYALFIPASVYYVNAYINENDRVKGQSLITLCTTVGGTFASLLGGILIDKVGVSYSLLVSAIISLVGFVIALFSVKEQR
ncbi:MAG: MFS transporter [Bacillota bacterium]|nr:MFS transporter [Bacillota bacterium]NLP22383.1 MFS transporter [Erysipelotrichaceae bacterium]